MQASVIISYYKNLAQLQLLLRALNMQSALGCFEVIISEDDDAPQTIAFMNELKYGLGFPLIHVSHPDQGFRKCKALNNAIRAANAELLIFFDGDCIPHKKCVQQYIKAQSQGAVLYGRRVMLSENFSSLLIKTKNIKLPSLLNLFKYRCRRIEDGIYFPVPRFLLKKTEGILLGCNMAINKKELLAINGFDEDYNFSGGGEDSDIEWRLKKLPYVYFKSMRFRAIVYHINHPTRFTVEQEKKNNAFMSAKITLGKFYCKNGLQK
jgi:glycosyltransferase involved in cell wall biosynthesis